MTVSHPPLAPDAPWIVLKFGGSSVARVDRWANIAALAAERRGEGARVLIVVSALAGVTDALAAAAAEDRPGRLAGVEAVAQRHIDFAGQLGVDAALPRRGWRSCRRWPRPRRRTARSGVPGRRGCWPWAS